MRIICLAVGDDDDCRGGSFTSSAHISVGGFYDDRGGIMRIICLAVLAMMMIVEVVVSSLQPTSRSEAFTMTEVEK